MIIKYKYNTLYEMLEENTKRYAKKTAIFQNKIRISYEKLKYSADKVAAYLQKKLKAKADDKIAIFAKNRWEYLATIFAISKIGAVAVPVNSFLKSKELSFILNSSQADILFADKELKNIVNGSTAIANCKQIIWYDENKESIDNTFNALLNFKGRSTKIDRDLNDTAVIFYTSGTTGPPKGALITNKNIFSNIESSQTLFNLTPRDRSIVFLPLFHPFSFTIAVMLLLYVGGSVVLLNSSEPFEEIIKQTLLRKVTIFFGMPDIYNIISKVNLPWYFKAFNRVKLFVSGAFALKKETINKINSKFPHIKLLEGYGLSETSPAVSINRLNKQKIGSVGPAMPSYKIKIVDDNNKELKENEVGEVLVYGDNIMKNYHNEKSNNKTKDGWFYTGDLGYLDSDGYLFLVDRKKDIIIHKGINIYPAEIEEVINRFDGVKRSAVVGKLDKKVGEVPVAFLEVYQHPHINIDRLKEYLKGFLADYKIPKEFIILEELPTTPTQKILKRKLRELLKKA